MAELALPAQMFEGRLIYSWLAFQLPPATPHDAVYIVFIPMVLWCLLVKVIYYLVADIFEKVLHWLMFELPSQAGDAEYSNK